MKLRYRLFFWVGLIFLLAFGVSLFFEVSLTDRNLLQEEAQLRQQVLEANEQSRQYIEKYLSTLLSESQAQVDALLLRLSNHPFPFEEPVWKHIGLLFQENTWLDFIQATRDKQLLALLVPLDRLMKRAYQKPIDALISWVKIEDQPLYIGVSLPNDEKQVKILFTPQMLQKMNPSQIPALDRAIAFVQNFQGDPPSSWNKEPNRSEPCLIWEGMSSKIIASLQRADQAGLIMQYLQLFPSSVLGDSPFSLSAPLGIAHFDGDQGEALFREEILYQKPLFDDLAYVTQHPSERGCQGTRKEMAIIAPSHLNRFFVGNTLQLPQNKLLTAGIDLEETIKMLVLMLHQTLLVVHDGQLVDGYTALGTKIAHFPVERSMLQNKSGLIQWQNHSYYYLHMQPFPQIDLHVYLLNPEEKAFALVNSIDARTREVIHKLSINMRLIAAGALIFVLILLHNLARHISQPISQLAVSTELVTKGKLEGIQLPSISPSRHDEVASLCRSFEKMITGLKEKEMVKGVLNKVVSHEIAQEILKSAIHLGGEERKVTMLFADIRHFTEMTRALAPHEVINLLNTCMTKISHLVDEFGGVIDKYVGDEVMALFGAPIDRADNALRAITSALKMVEVLKAWNAERLSQGLFKVEVGIGIHTGTVLVGNMGAEDRLNYTVIGSNVNLAARLCGIAQGMQILISKETLQEPHVQQKVATKELPPAKLKGFEEPIPLYEVVGLNETVT